MKKYSLLILVFAVLLLGAGFYAGYKVFKPKVSTEEVSSEIILTLLKSEGFLITESYVFNQNVTIDRSTGSQIKDIFFGQNIQASANMKVAAGIDLGLLTAKDVQVSDKAVVITLPEVKTNGTEIIGNIVLTNRQGIIKRIVDNDDGYNAALALLKQEATKAAEVPELREEAKQSALREVERLVKFIQPEKEIRVQFE